jgi:hypothetical protein
LPNDHLKQILVRYGDFDFVDVQNLSRNELFRRMVESDDAEMLLKRGVSLLVQLQSQRGVEEEADDHLLVSIAQTSPTVKTAKTSASFARRTPEKSIKKTIVKKAKPKAQKDKSKAKPKAKSKPANKQARKSNKTAAQKKRERALKRCAT